MYATIEEADNYYSKVFNSKWGSLSDDMKETLLNNATINIDNKELCGKKKEEDQELEFPRVYCDGEETDMNVIKRACILEAMNIYNTGGVEVDSSGIKSFKLGDVDVTFADSATATLSNIDQLLGNYIINGVRVI